jgi:signal transduction histidine kinase
MNIFGNALKYTEKGSIVIRLSLDPSEGAQESAAEERTLEITVTDTGKGISSEFIRTRLFNRMSAV